MKKQKKPQQEVTAEQIYKSNLKKAKRFKLLAPVTLYLFLMLALLFLILALTNSVGNVMNILNMLDKKQHTGVEIAQNYDLLKEKWGVWEIASVSGVSIEYVNIQKAFFNGASETYLILAVVFLVAAIALGKILFPQLCNMYKSANEQMADLAAIQTSEIVKEKKNKGDWF